MQPLAAPTVVFIRADNQTPAAAERVRAIDTEYSDSMAGRPQAEQNAQVALYRFVQNATINGRGPAYLDVFA